jgi:hypothetical protein
MTVLEPDVVDAKPELSSELLEALGYQAARTDFVQSLRDATDGTVLFVLSCARAEHARRHALQPEDVMP